MSADTAATRRVLPAREYFFPAAPRSADEELAVEDAFFRILRMRNGTYKTTARGRMPDVDAAIADALAAARAGAAAPARVLDVGVSSGTTTADLLDVLASRGLRTRTLAADLVVDAWLRRVGPGVDVLVDSHGVVIQLAFPGLVKGRPHDPEGSLQRRALQFAFDAFERAVATRRPPRAGDRPVRLISARLARRPDVTVVEHDVNERRAEWEGGFDLVRVANLLNFDYFARPVLERMCGNVRSYVAPGGLLAVARTTDDGVNSATIFRRDGDALTVVARVGAGSEVEALMLGAR